MILNNENSIKHSLILFMVALYPIIVLPGPFDNFREPRYIFLATISSISLYFIISEKIDVKKPILILIGLFLIFGLISTILADSFYMGMMGSITRITGFSTTFFCVVLFFLAAQLREPKKLILPLVFTAGVVSIIAVFQYLGFDPLFFLDVKAGSKVSSTLGNRNWLGTYTVFILPAPIIFYIYSKKFFWLLFAITIYAGLLVSLTRGSWLAFSIIFLIIFFHFLRNKKLGKHFAILILSFAIISFLLTPANDFLLYKRVFGIPQEVSAGVSGEGSAGSGRVYIWKAGLTSFMENWAFGIGPDHFYFITPGGNIADKTHNIFLEIAVTMGLFSFLVFLAFLSFFIRFRNDKWTFLFVVMILSYLFQGFFNIDVIQVMPLFWIVLGLSLAYKNEEDSPSHYKNTKKIAIKKSKPFLQILLFSGIMVFLISSSIWYYYPKEGVLEIPDLGRYEGSYRGANAFHGEGLLEYYSGHSYKGKFRNGYFEGYGKLTFPNGAKFFGTFIRGNMHGVGIMTFPDGKVVWGEWNDGVLVKEFKD